MSVLPIRDFVKRYALTPEVHQLRTFNCQAEAEKNRKIWTKDNLWSTNNRLIGRPRLRLEQETKLEKTSWEAHSLRMRLSSRYRRQLGFAVAVDNRTDRSVSCSCFESSNFMQLMAVRETPKKLNTDSTSTNQSDALPSQQTTAVTASRVCLMSTTTWLEIRYINLITIIFPLLDFVVRNKFEECRVWWFLRKRRVFLEKYWNEYYPVLPAAFWLKNRKLARINSHLTFDV